MSPKILRCVSIKQGQVLVDGAGVFEHHKGGFAEFSQLTYKQLQADYPKFHKMDNLAKLGFLAAEFLLTDKNLLAGAPPEQIGIVVANATSSTDTDLRYNAQVQKQLASPALFVYTLPNIVLGEICIRHGIKGENMLFVADAFDAHSQVAYIRQLFADSVMTTCIAGWLDFFDQEYRAFLYVVGNSTAPALPDYTASQVHTLFNT